MKIFSCLPFLAIAIFFVEKGCSLSASLISKYNISDVTVSGLSSGGFMTVQVHVAWSSIFQGAAIFAGGPYYCSQNDRKKTAADCSIASRDGPDVNTLIEYTKQFSSEGKIDPYTNLYDDPVMLWMGKYDTMVGIPTGIANEEYYKYFVDNAKLKMDHTFPAQHTMPTLDWGAECTKLRPPFVGNCSYDGAGDALQHILGPLKTPVDPIPENLMEFNQTYYIPTDNTMHSLNDIGFIYVPTACQDTNTVCHLHFSIHGCTQTELRIGDIWADKTGYNRWAEANDIVVIYPNIINSYDSPQNPLGCWDYWGYSGSDYAFQTGVQLRFIRNLVKAASGI